MNFLITLFLGYFIMVMEGPLLAVFQVDALAIQTPLALALLVARDRPFDQACWLLSFWLYPAYTLLLIPDLRWLLALVIVFFTSIGLRRTFPTELYSIHLLQDLFLLFLHAAIVIFLTWVLSINPRIGSAAFHTILPSMLVTSIAIQLFRFFFNRLEQRFTRTVVL